MSEIMFGLMEIVVSASAALVAAYLVPFIKAKTADTKYKKLLGAVEVAVKAAEQTIKGGGKGAAKKDEVISSVTAWMLRHGIIITQDQLDQLIEAAVYNLKKE